MKGGLPVINPLSAGIDIGDKVHSVALPDGKGGHRVHTFGCFTEDLHSIVRLLKDSSITTVAMEATGVYYVSLYLMLEENGITPYLVNSRHTRNVAGRKTDDSDAVWIQKLHTYGLLHRSFQPEAQNRTLREYVRHRATLITLNSDSVRRMQKAFELMNVKIHTVISDLLGKTGMTMIEAILNGERNPEVLAGLRDPRVKASEEDIRKSLNGIWKDEYLFMLRQAHEEYTFRSTQIKACESKIEDCLKLEIAILNDGDLTIEADAPSSEKKS